LTHNSFLKHKDASNFFSQRECEKLTKNKRMVNASMIKTQTKMKFFL